MMPKLPIAAPGDAEVLQLREEARDWQKQFHTLKTAVEKLGYTVGYDDTGQPAIRA